MNQQDVLQRIRTLLGRFNEEVKFDNANGDFGINMYAENVLLKVLNGAYGWDLNNINYEEGKYYPAIDLHDEAKKIAVQVTSSGTVDKVVDSLGKCAQNGFDKKYEHLYFYFLKGVDDKVSIENPRIASVLGGFSPEAVHFLDHKKFYLYLNQMNDLGRLTKIRDLLEEQFSDAVPVKENVVPTQGVFNTDNSFMLFGRKNEIEKASITQREQIFKGNNKFNGLKIFEGLIPFAEAEARFDEPVGVDTEDKEGKEVLLDEYFEKHANENLMLIGEGGIGKTTFLAHLMETITPDKDSAVVPIYIELNCCPPEVGDWYVDIKKKTNFITRYIASLIDHRDLGQYSSDELTYIENALCYQSDRVYLLLLDGFNEVNVTKAEGRKAGISIRELLQQEITALCKCPGVRVILTTREMTDGYLPDGFRKIRLKGLDDEKIVNYLNVSNFSNTDIKWIRTNRSLMECLRIPLFICMFACRNQYEKIHPTTKGEILYHFFHRGTPFYSEKKKIRDMFAANQSEVKFLAFIEDFLLPAIAYDMYMCGTFQLSKKRMAKCVESALKDPLIEYAVETSGFTDYEMETSSLDDVYNAIRREKTEDIIYRCVNVLAIINSGSGQGIIRYAFIHHHIRDYFAAYYIVQRIRCALYHFAEQQSEQNDIRLDRNPELFMNVRGSLEPIYYERLDDTLKQFIGEILGEHRNVPVLVDKKTWRPATKVFDEQDTLKTVLDMFRYQSAEPRNTINNIIEIFKTVRDRLSGENFDGLNLQNCCFYETICSSGISQYKVSASFRNCSISDQSFWFRGHLGRFRDIKMSMNNRLLFTYGEDNQVCIWELPSMYQKMHYAVDISSYPEAHSPYQTEIVVSGANEFMIPAYDTDFRDNETITLQSKIVHYSMTSGVLDLTEDGENREVMCMSYSYDGKILGIWGSDTLRVFDSETGDLCKKIIFQVPGETLGVIYTSSGQVVLQVRIEEEKMTKSVILHSRWALYLLDQDSGDISPLLEYASAKSVMHPKNTPAFSVDAGARYFVFYSERAVRLYDLTAMTVQEIWRFNDDSVPIWIQFLNFETPMVVVQWEDKLLYLSILGGEHVLYENSKLPDAELCAFAKDRVYFVDDEGKCCQWDLVTDTISEELIPRVKLGIEDIQQDYSENLIVRYSNNCIQTIDISTGMLIDTFYSNDNDAVIEASLYLTSINRQLIVLRTIGYEQVILYDNHTGMIQRIDIYAYDRFKFVRAHAAGNVLFIGFDKKVIAIDLMTMRQAEVWRQRAGEILFDMEIGDDNGPERDDQSDNANERHTVLLLLQWRMLCKRPAYLVISGSVEEGFTECGKRNVEYIDASKVNNLVIWKSDDIEYYGMDAISDQPIYTAKVLWKQGNRHIRKRLFMLVENLKAFKESVMLGSNTFMTQLDEDWTVTVKDYSEIGIIDNRTGNKTVVRIQTPDDQDCLVEILDCFMSRNHKLYCRSIEDKLIQVDAETGLLEKTFDFMPGIIVSGCDFTGSKLSENMKHVLIQHGAVFH